MMARKDARFPVRCSVAYALEDAAHQGMTFSLSRGGCAIESDEMASEGETVSLQIMEPGLSTAIRVELGRICWATRREFGVEFLVILDDSKERLNHFLLKVAKQRAV
ncbi:MAG: PilZ domain-containing protein [Nitrospiraceae bacterium]